VQGQGQRRERQDEAYYTTAKSSNKRYSYDANVTCGFCKRIGHKEDDCFTKKRKAGANANTSANTGATTTGTTSTGSKTRTPKECFYCKKPGHLIRDCFKFKDHEKDKNSAGQALLAHAHATGSIIIDSGASQHMFKDISAFDDDIRDHSSSVTCADNNIMQSKHIGRVSLSIDSDVGDENLILRDVLHVPELKSNLLSVVALNRDGKRVSFEPNGTVTMSDGDNTQTIGRNIGNLYHLTANSENYNAYQASTNSRIVDNFKLWHYRLGHASQGVLETLKRHVIGIDDEIKVPSIKEVCVSCAQGKSHRRSFPIRAKESRANQVLERINTDLCGPFDPPSLAGSRYVITFIDDYSRYTYAYFIANKSNAFETFKKYRALVEKQTSKPIKCL
jgi:hypothetical protein